MPIITADNYMDETFFHCNRISSPSSSCLLASNSFFFASIRKHTFWIVQKGRKREIQLRQNTEFIYDKPMQQLSKERQEK
jgi:hypothetical protein